MENRPTQDARRQADLPIDIESQTYVLMGRCGSHMDGSAVTPKSTMTAAGWWGEHTHLPSEGDEL